MANTNPVSAQIIKQGVLPLYFNEDANTSIELMKALYEAGIRSIEYTNRGANALANFKAMKKNCDENMPDMQLGVGTITNSQMAKAFIDAGCDYIICPGLVEEVANAADAHNIFWIPGCMTPTEIIAAERMGASMVKLFPGNMLAKEFMASINDLFPNLVFMPTGGVDATKESIEGWFKAGVSAVGMGSKLVSKTIMEEKKYTQLTEDTKKVMAIIEECKK